MPDADSHSQTSSVPVSSNPQSVGDNATTVNAAVTSGPALPTITVPSDHVSQIDPNPRSPKRRRITPLALDDELDIEGAAERALAEFNATTTSVSQDRNATSLPPSEHNVARPPLGPPSRELRIDHLPFLDDLATQLLSFLAKMNNVEIGQMLFGPPSARGQEYRALKASFEQAKRTYHTVPPFLSPQALGLLESHQVDILRRTNLATFMASIFSGEHGLRAMDMNFIDIFVPENGRLLKAHASIFLELKTQAFIAAARTAPGMLNQVMLDLFPADLDQQLLRRRPGSKHLAPTEQDFLKRLGSRRDLLWSLVRNNKLDDVHETYNWNNFAREVSTYLTKYVENIASGNKDRSNPATPEPEMPSIPQREMENKFTVQAGPAVSSALRQETSVIPPLPSMSGDDFSLDDFIAQAARATEIAMGLEPEFSVPVNLQQQQPDTRVTPAPSATTSSSQPHAQPPSKQESLPRSLPPMTTEFQHYDPTGAGASSDHAEGEVPHSSQTAPTQVLYERARQVTTSKSSPLGRKGLPPNHRRPWTTEEENALMTGLDEVKGPHWSQILAMYGPGGTVNESLKDRNQVQLKDKARNLKLFFLKAGIEVPYYLQAVTGDLKSRAPGQAEKLEREKGQGDSDRGTKDEAQMGAETPEQADLGNGQSGGSTPNGYQAIEEQSLEDIATEVIRDDDTLDMEAVMARAAAQAQEEFGSHAWND